LAALAFLPAAARGEEVALLGEPIDLRGFDAPGDLDGLLEPVGLVRGDDCETRRFYLAPIVGVSWGQLLLENTSVLRSGLFSAGGAAGLAFTRPGGQLRTEFEGRYRDGMCLFDSFGPVAIRIRATDNWSTLFNVWRDIAVTDRFGLYGGGGLGLGGYNFCVSGNDGVNFLSAGDQNTAFAWQAGVGAIYAVSDRITLDIGYRYYSVDASRATVWLDPAGVPVGSLRNQFIANELMFAVRIYEPFRRWR
jgi:opacity protein-like surface antigen